MTQHSKSTTIALQDVPWGTNWGWCADAPPRMHLQALTGPYVPLRLWLEREGRRVIEPEGHLSASLLRQIEGEIHAQRGSIDEAWVLFMRKRGWLKLSFQNPVLSLVAYPGEREFHRRLDLAEEFPGAYPTGSGHLERGWRDREVLVDLDDGGRLAIGPEQDTDARNHFLLGEVLWHG